MNKSNLLLSEITAFRTYAKFLPHLSRRESFEETINRDMVMHLERFPKLSRDIIKSFQQVHDRKVMPSMRSLQFAGDAILKNNARSYNCSYSPINDIRSFGEALFLLLSGVGFGYSVQKIHVNCLPKVTTPKEEGVFLIHDSIQGWAQAIDILMEAYLYGRIRPVFDFSSIRAKGSYLSTTGAKAPGPEPLKLMLKLIEDRLKLAIGRKLKPVEIHDLICIEADSVLAGGIRRAACACLFDKDDDDMLKCKTGNWWEKHPYRARANNSAVLLRDETKQDEFNYIFDICKESNCGEPGFYWTNDLDIGTNPCFEQSLLPYEFCNLTTINQTGIKDKKDFLNRVYSATLVGTLQASYTEFPYLRPMWKDVTERESLLGVSFTGIADSNIPEEWLSEGAQLALEVNEKYAKKLGINLAARITTVKPEGTSSCILGSSSGIHARHSEFYLRRIRMNKDDNLALYLRNTIPELIEDDVTSTNGLVLTLPQESPKDAITRENETAIQLLNRALIYNKNWIRNGHRIGKNYNNVSLTISVKDSEWDDLRKVMWKNREYYAGISLLPYDGGNYKQAPFQSCDKDKYDEYMKLVKDIDLKDVVETTDNTNKMEILSCNAGACEIT